MEIKEKNILITGADGGIGFTLLEKCIDLGANTIYAAGINKKRLDEIASQFINKVQAITLDVTNYDNCLEVAKQHTDVDIVINCAGVELAKKYMEIESLKTSKFEMSVNYYGIHNLCHAMKDNLLLRPEAIIVNILSVGSFMIVPKLATYCASKAAAHILTQALRKELSETSISVLGVYPGYIDTEMTINLDVDKVSPESICNEICYGIINSEEYIFPDPMSKELSIKSNYINAFC